MKKLIVVLSLLIVGWLVVGCKTNVEPEPNTPEVEIVETKWNVTKIDEPITLTFSEKVGTDTKKYTVEGYKFKVVTYPKSVEGVKEGTEVKYYATWRTTFNDTSCGTETLAVIFDEDVESEIEKILNSGGYEIVTEGNDKYVLLEGNEEKWCSKGVQKAKNSKQGETTSWDEVTISSISTCATVSSIDCPKAFQEKYAKDWPTPEEARNIKILWKDTEENYHAVIGENEDEIRNLLKTKKLSFEPVETYISKLGNTQKVNGKYCIVILNYEK